jgi:uncharacterized protein (DUF58 family)
MSQGGATGGPLGHPSPEVVARIAHLAVRARGIVEGALSGQHRSPHRGSSVEFAEHKEYSPGDEPRHIDWKAYAKLDRPYVKRFEEETELSAHLCIDSSGSMGYASPGHPTKLAYAAELGCALAYLLLGQGDRVGLRLFSSGKLWSVGTDASDPYGDVLVPGRRRRSHLGEVCRAIALLEASGARGPSELLAALEEVQKQAGRRHLVLVISDFMALARGDDANLTALRRLLGRLRARHHDVVLFQVLDPFEIDFPFDGPTLFRGMEPERAGGDGAGWGKPAEVLTDPAGLRQAYLDALAALRQGLSRACAESDVTYRFASTATPPEDVLGPFLAQRTRGRRGGAGPRP